jgi:prepilin-type N-terminal cleavage/methylation domain-containing protein
MDLLRRRTGPEAGFTLVELLLAVSILGISAVAVVGGMMTSIQVSDLGRRQAEGQVQLRAYAEAVAGAPYTNCAAGYGTSFTPSAGYTATMTVTYWNGTSAFTSTCGTDSGMQRVTLTISASDGRGSETVAIAKRAP